MTGVQVASGGSVTLVVRGSDKLVLEETEKSIDVLSDVNKEKVSTLSSVCSGRQ